MKAKTWRGDGIWSSHTVIKRESLDLKLGHQILESSSLTTVLHHFLSLNKLCTAYRDVMGCGEVEETNGNRKWIAGTSPGISTLGVSREQESNNAAKLQLTPCYLHPGSAALVNRFLWLKAGIFFHNSTDVRVPRGDWPWLVTFRPSGRIHMLLPPQCFIFCWPLSDAPPPERAALASSSPLLPLLGALLSSTCFELHTESGDTTDWGLGARLDGTHLGVITICFSSRPQPLPGSGRMGALPSFPLKAIAESFWEDCHCKCPSSSKPVSLPLWVTLSSLFSSLVFISLWFFFFNFYFGCLHHYSEIHAAASTFLLWVYM